MDNVPEEIDEEFDNELQDFLASQPPIRVRAREENNDGDNDEDDDEDDLEVMEEEEEEEEATSQQVSIRRTLAFRVAEVLKSENVPASKEVLMSMAELTRKYVDTLGEDLEAFSEHARRKTFSTADVLLSARRNPSLQRLLHEAIKEKQSAPKKRRKKTAAPVAPLLDDQDDDNDMLGLEHMPS